MTRGGSRCGAPYWRACCLGCITKRGQPCRCRWSQYRSCQNSRGCMMIDLRTFHWEGPIIIISLGLLSNWIACTEITKKQTNVFYFLFIFCYYYYFFFLKSDYYNSRPTRGGWCCKQAWPRISKTHPKQVFSPEAKIYPKRWFHMLSNKFHPLNNYRPTLEVDEKYPLWVSLNVLQDF